jgi:hypothetical protein
MSKYNSMGLFGSVNGSKKVGFVPPAFRTMARRTNFRRVFYPMPGMPVLPSAPSSAYTETAFSQDRRAENSALALTDPSLLLIVEAWPDLPEAIKAAHRIRASMKDQ